MRRFVLQVLCVGMLHVATAGALERAETVAFGASVYRVEVPATRGGFGVGSGVAIGPDRVVTNCHVVGEAATVFVVRAGVRRHATTHARDQHHDLCMLEVPGLGATPLRLGRSADLRAGQALTAIGFTGGAGIQVSEGEVVRLHAHDGARVIQSSNWFSSGASGGALLDQRGQLVGILTFRLRGGAEHYFSAPAEWVAQVNHASAGDLPSAADLLLAPSMRARGPFWQDDTAAQPRFLKAAKLQLNARWAELETLAFDWTRLAPQQAEPWALLGMALERQGRLGEARIALGCSLLLAPEDTPPANPVATLPHSSDPTDDGASRSSPCPRERP